MSGDWAEAELVELKAQFAEHLEEYKAELAQARINLKHTKANLDFCTEKRFEQQAELERVKAERDAGGRELVRLIPQLDRALTALREIAELSPGGTGRVRPREIARAAIAEIEAKR